MHNFYPGDYLFIYDYDENNVVGLIQPTTESADRPEVEIQYEDVVDTTGDHIMEAMRRKNGKICNDYYYSFGEEL